MTPATQALRRTDDLRAAAAAALLPPEPMPLLHFARTEYRLPEVGAAEGGAFTPMAWQEEICRALDDPATQVVAIMASAQTGKSEIAICATQWACIFRPAPAALYHATDDQALAYAKDRVSPGLLATPRTRRALMGRRSVEGQTVDRKSFTTGAVLNIMGATQQNLASRPLGWIAATELRGMKRDLGGQGSPVAMMKARGRSFKRFFKAIFESSPTEPDDLIHTEFLAGTQERWCITCPDCGHNAATSFFPMEGRFHVHFDPRKPEEAAFACPECGSLMTPEQRLNALRAGFFRATNPTPVKGVRSFQISEVSVPSSSLASIVERYLIARKQPHTLQTFVNLVLGEPHEAEARTVQISASDLRDRAETYRADVMLPPGVLLVVTGVDGQPDRFEAATWGFGAEGEAWLLDYAVIPGQTEYDGEVWRRLEAYLSQSFRHPFGGLLTPETAFVDSGGTGGYTQQCYLWSAKHQAQGRRWIATKGKEGQDRQLVEVSKAVLLPGAGQSARLRIIGVDKAKTAIFERLELTAPGPGFLHFPDNLPPTFFDGLAASEKAVIRGYDKATGSPIIRFVKTGIARNEPLDTAVLALAAASLFPLDVERRRRDLTAQPQPSEEHQEPKYGKYRALMDSINAQARR